MKRKEERPWLICPLDNAVFLCKELLRNKLSGVFPFFPLFEYVFSSLSHFALFYFFPFEQKHKQ